MSAADDFWEFSLRVYGTDAVAPACLDLQENLGVDVNVLLFCCWAGAVGGGRLGPDAIRDGLETVTPWHTHVVRGLRAVRQRMKEGFKDLPPEKVEERRQNLLNLEIETERLEQHVLADTVSVTPDSGPPTAERVADAAANVADYFAVAGFGTYAARNAQVAVVLAASIPGLEQADIAGAVERAFKGG